MIKLLVLILCLLLAVIPSKRALHMFQQNRYELYRYSHWLFRKQTFEVSGLYLFVAALVIGHFFKGWLNTVIFPRSKRKSRTPRNAGAARTTATRRGSCVPHS